jgi:hypothetical protein
VQVKAALGILGLAILAGSLPDHDAHGDSARAPGRCAVQAWADPWPYLDRPADPWLAVAGGKPIAVAKPKDRAGMMGSPRAACDAAHDHCLRDCTWLSTATATSRRATTMHFGQDPLRPGFVAYRTVPVTRKNLAKGMLVAALVDSTSPLRSGSITDPSGTRIANTAWDVGIVASIEWDRNLVRLEGVTEPYYLSGTRLAVLRYTGDTVERIDGVDDKAPALADVIQPSTTVEVSDPWSQIGKDKRPLAVADATPLSGRDENCSGKADHCLRPWVWFVNVEGDPIAARWTGAKFVHAADPARGIDAPGTAFRTRPAKESELVPGKKILLFDSATSISSEADAHHWRAWTFATVESVDRYTHTMVLKGGGSKRPTDNARLMVVSWLPGETAAAVD